MLNLCHKYITMDTESKIQKKHTLLITGEGVEVSGVESVVSYDEKEVVIKLSAGTGGQSHKSGGQSYGDKQVPINMPPAARLVNLIGTDFKIEKLDVESGRLEISGTVAGVKYGGTKQKKGLLKRLIK